MNEISKTDKQHKRKLEFVVWFGQDSVTSWSGMLSSFCCLSLLSAESCKGIITSSPAESCDNTMLEPEVNKMISNTMPELEVNRSIFDAMPEPENNRWCLCLSPCPRLRLGLCPCRCLRPCPCLCLSPCTCPCPQPSHRPAPGLFRGNGYYNLCSSEGTSDSPGAQTIPKMCLKDTMGVAPLGCGSVM